MIGFYDYTVILTYLSLLSSMTGLFCSFTGHLNLAITFLALSGLLDTFDGKVARSKKNRTDDEKAFGIQIDSLCDLVCFGVLPVSICYHSGINKVWEMGILSFYCLAGLIRLAYFNVLEGNRQKVSNEKNKYYQGLPITSISVILPVVFLSSAYLHANFEILLDITMLITGFLFIKRFKFRKPTNKEIAALIIFVSLVILFILINYRWKGYFTWNWRSLAEAVD